MAFLVLLERLTPVERAVFLLREVFDYEYPDIAKTLGRSEAGCRQLFRRAQQNIGAARRRFTASALERRQLLERFLQATRSEDMTGLLDLFSTDVVLRSDGGGKAIAVPNLIQGAETSRAQSWFPRKARAEESGVAHHADERSAGHHQLSRPQAVLGHQPRRR